MPRPGGRGFDHKGRAVNRIVTGVESLDRALGELKTGAANRAARSGLTKGARFLAKKTKAEVPSRLKSVRKAIGHRVGVNKRTKQFEAKVGAGVGRRKSPGKRSTKGGVGISSNNIHWWILGTDDRYHKSGHYTGRMPAHPAVKAAAAKHGDATLRLVTEQTWVALEREAAKLRAKQMAK